MGILENVADGSTTVTKQTKQVTQVGGLGGTSYNVGKTTAGGWSLQLSIIIDQHLHIYHMTKHGRSYMAQPLTKLF